MKAVVCTIAAGPHEELLAINQPGLISWATRFGYSLDIRTEPLTEARPVAWSKVLLMQELLVDHDVVIWVDADTWVTPQCPDAVATVCRRRPLGLVAHTYNGQTVPNTGFIVMRSGPTARRLLRRLWSMEQYRDHKWWENAALLDLLGYDISQEPIRRARPSLWTTRVAWLDVAWNSIDQDQSPAPYVKHYPGMEHEARLERLRADSAPTA